MYNLIFSYKTTNLLLSQEIIKVITDSNLFITNFLV